MDDIDDIEDYLAYKKEKEARSKKVGVGGTTVKWLKIFGCATVLAFVAAPFIAASGMDSIRRNNESHTDQQESKPLDWALWKDGEDPPNARIVIKIDWDASESITTSYSSTGYIRGFVYNQTGRDLSYISIGFGQYAENGAKYGGCMDNINGVAAGGKWEFEVACFDWRDNTSIQLENVNYR